MVVERDTVEEGSGIGDLAVAQIKKSGIGIGVRLAVARGAVGIEDGVAFRIYVANGWLEANAHARIERPDNLGVRIDQFVIELDL